MYFMSSKRPKWNCKQYRLTSLLHRHKNRSQYLQQFLQTLYDTLNTSNQQISFKPQVKAKLDPTFTEPTLAKAAAELNRLLTQSAHAYNLQLSPNSNYLDSLNQTQLNKLIQLLNDFISGTQDSNQTIEQQLLLEQNPQLINIMQLIPRPTATHADDEKHELELEPQAMFTSIFAGLFSLFLFFMDFCIDLAYTPTETQLLEAKPENIAVKKPPTPSPYQNTDPY